MRDRQLVISRGVASPLPRVVASIQNLAEGLGVPLLHEGAIARQGLEDLAVLGALGAALALVDILTVLAEVEEDARKLAIGDALDEGPVPQNDDVGIALTGLEPLGVDPTGNEAGIDKQPTAAVAPGLVPLEVPSVGPVAPPLGGEGGLGLRLLGSREEMARHMDELVPFEIDRRESERSDAEVEAEYQLGVTHGESFHHYGAGWGPSGAIGWLRANRCTSDNP